MRPGQRDGKTAQGAFLCGDGRGFRIPGSSGLPEREERELDTGACGNLQPAWRAAPGRSAG